MALQDLTITFSAPLNVSLQIGDLAYYVPTTQSGGFNTGSYDEIIQFGTVSAIDPDLENCPGANCAATVTVQWENTSGIPLPSGGEFILFSKSKKINSSSLTGYYADVQFSNNSNKKIELFSVGSEIHGSSK
tara:strand:- start:68 stop:463 length:396 start_codon:yes stop_codon:yes gene_type:complete